MRSGSSCTSSSGGRHNQLPIQVAELMTSWALLLQNVLHCHLASNHSCCSAPLSVIKEARNASAFSATSALPTVWGLSAALLFLTLPTFSSCSLSRSFPACRYRSVQLESPTGAVQPVTLFASLHAGTAAGCKAGSREVTRGEQPERQTMLADVCHGEVTAAKPIKPSQGRSDQDMTVALQRPKL